MAADLTNLQGRMRAILMDDDGLAWEDATLAEGVRQALGEYGLARGAAVSIAGLDGAGVTTLDPLHDSLIVWGAAGFCALARAVDRAENASVAVGNGLGGDSAGLRAWGDGRLAEFRNMLAVLFGTARTAGLRAAGSAPWGVWEDACTSSF